MNSKKVEEVTPAYVVIDDEEIMHIERLLRGEITIEEMFARVEQRFTGKPAPTSQLPARRTVQLTE